MAYRESNVFKFADKVGVRFMCEIKLCLKVDNGCQGITVSRSSALVANIRRVEAILQPPICDSSDRSFQEFQDDNQPEDAEWQLESNNTAESAAVLEAENTSGNKVETPSVSRCETIDEPKNFVVQRIGAKRKRSVSMPRLVVGSTATRSPPPSNGSGGQPAPANTVSTDLISQYVYVLDSSDNPDELTRLNSAIDADGGGGGARVAGNGGSGGGGSGGGVQRMSAWHSGGGGGGERSTSICLSSSMLAAAIVVIMLVLLVAFAGILHLHIRRSR